MKQFWTIVLIIAILGAALYFFPRTMPNRTADIDLGSVTANVDPGRQEVTSAIQDELSVMVYANNAQLLDVTEGKVVRGIVTNNTSGFARSHFADGKFSLFAQFGNLPEPQSGDHYEAWIGNGRGDLVNLGTVEKVGNVYTTLYRSTSDLTDHDMFMVTIEATDGDSSAGEKILEGEFSRTN